MIKLFPTWLFLFGLLHFTISSYGNETGNAKSDTLLSWLDSVQKQCQQFENTIPDTCLYYAGIAMEAIQHSTDSIAISKAYEMQGDAFVANSEFNMAIDAYLLSMEYIDNEEHPEIEASIMLKLGKTYTINLQQTEAIEMLHRALEAYQALQQPIGQIQSLTLIGEYYRKLADYDLATQYLTRANELMDDELSRSETAIHLYNRIAAVMDETGNLDEAIRYSNIALNLAKEVENLHYQAISLNELGFIYEKKDKDIAEEYYKKAARIWEAKGFDRYYANVLANLARTNYMLNRLDKALRYTDSLEVVIMGKNWLTLEYDLFYRRAVIYENRKKYEKAYRNRIASFERFIQIYKKEQDEKIAEIEHKYDAKEKELLIENQNQELEIERNRLADKKKEQLWILIAGAAFFLLFILLAFAYIALRKDRKQLDVLNRKLSKTVEQKEIAFREIHHRVKNNLNMLSGLVHLQLSGLKDKNTIEAIEGLQSRIDTIAFVHQQLLDVAEKPRIQIGQFFHAFVENIAEPLAGNHVIVKKEINCPILEIPLKSALPIALITNELMTNSMKHGYTGQDNFTIGFKIENKGNRIYLYLYDNGKGIEDLSEIDNPLTGGFKLVKLLTEQLKGKLTYSRYELSEFIISFELNN